MHPRLPASIIHGMRFGCTLAYPPSSPSTPSSFTGCTSDAPYATHRHSTQGARSLHPSPPTVTIIPHKVHIGCTLAVSLSSLTRCTLQAPQPYHPHYSQGAHWTHPRCITMHTCHAQHTCYAWTEWVPCTRPARYTRMPRMCDVCILHMPRAPRTCCARVTHVPCTCHALHAYHACAVYMPCTYHAPHTCNACAPHVPCTCCAPRTHAKRVLECT